MAEFVLNTSNIGSTNGVAKVHPYYDLDDFARGYVEAMFFTNGDCGSDDEKLLNRLGVGRLTRAACADIKADCDKFLSTVMPDGRFARQWIDELVTFPATFGDGVQDDRRAGRMFWYARQRHGVGWSDDYGGVKAMAVADGLQDACRAFGEADVEVWRGWIAHR